MSERTILIVDDSPFERAHLKDAVLLSGLFSNIIEAGNGSEALKIFITHKIDFIITDVVMPEIDGYKLINAIREMECGCDIPIIMLTSNKKAFSDKIQGFTFGASDYLIKPFDKVELIARIKVLLKMHILQEELRARNELLEKLATTDELTLLPNRRHFFETAKTIVALAKRNALPIACLVIDIDFFKKVNDTYGHQAGDIVLRNVAETMHRIKREGELLARLGGEEFVMCIFKAGEKEGAIAAERFRKAIENMKTPVNETTTLSVTISVGCSELPPDSLTDVDQMIALADEALYRAKKRGRNRVETYSEVAAHVDNIDSCV